MPKNKLDEALELHESDTQNYRIWEDVKQDLYKKYKS